MGYESHFVKATGDCRIMAIPFKKAIEDYKKRHNIDYSDPIDPYDLSDSRKQVDEISGEEYYPLKRFGKAIHYQKFYGYFGGSITFALHTMYESMSIDHASCYESEMKYELTREEEQKIRSTFDADQVEETVKGKLDICGDFETVEDFKLLFKDFLINDERVNDKRGFVRPSSIENQILSDVDIVTQSDYLENDEFKRKTRKYNTEPCRLYFTTEDLYYLYLEFLPFGKGIKLAMSRPLDNADIEETGDYSDFKFLGDVRDEAFDWRVMYLDCKKNNFFQRF